ADDPLGICDREGDGGRGVHVALIGDVRVDLPAAVLGDQLGGTAGGQQRQLRVHAALEALGGLGRQAVAARGAGHGDLLEGRGLEVHVPGGPGDLGVLTAHDTGDAQHPVAVPTAVGDQQVLGVQATSDVIEGG